MEFRQESMLERDIAFHCGPALAGIKSANLFCADIKKYPFIYDGIKQLNKRLNCCGIFFLILSENKGRVQILAYRREKLEKYLTDKNILDFLHSQGYPEEFSLDNYLNILKSRISDYCEFPHEIGAFLGYPIEDIYGFINHPKEGCLYCGYWKVYDDAEAKRELFKRFDICRNCIVNRVEMGIGLDDLFKSA